MSTETTEDVDLSDLGLLDDTKRHARCTACQPKDIGLAMPFIALCGTRAVYLTEWTEPDVVPPDACDECERLWFAPCLICGVAP